MATIPQESDQAEVLSTRMSLSPSKQTTGLQAVPRSRQSHPCRNGPLPDKHRNVTRKLVLEGGWVQKRLYGIGWSDEKRCRGCNK